MIDLTEIQRKIFRFIEDEIASKGFPPTYRAIQGAFAFKSIGTVQDHLRALIRKGYLQKEDHKAKTLHLPNHRRSESVSIPILGAIAAGYPTDAQPHVQGAISIPQALAKKGAHFALRVRGDSMQNAGIYEGDLVIVRQQETAKTGEIVVAIIDNEPTVKRLDKHEGLFRLMPENPRYKPIAIKSERDVVQGKVVGVMRYYENV